MDKAQKETPEAAASHSDPAKVVAANDTPASPAPFQETPVVPTEPSAIEPESASFYVDPSATEEIADKTVTWSASEFHAHEKTVSWYILLGFATTGLGAALYFLTKSVVSPVVVVIGGIMLGVFGTHRPNQIEYGLDRKGIRIGTKQYLYDEFRLFIVTPQSISPEVTLIPTKRFMPSLSLRYTPEVEDQVLGVLADHLPFEERRLDLVDNLMQRIRF